MPRIAKPLTATECKQAKPLSKDYSLTDGQGLYLLVKPTGSKLWRFQYTYPKGKRNLASFGSYPEISLEKARKIRAEWLEKIKQGIDPKEERQEAKAQEERDTKGQFHLVIKEWVDSLKCSHTTAMKRYRAFERDIFPHFCTFDGQREVTASRPISMITHPELLKAILEKSRQTPETAQRIFQDCKQVWRFAMGHGYTDRNVTDFIDPHTVPRPEAKHYPKISDPETIRDLIYATDAYHGQPITRHLLRFVLLAPLRADNLCNLRWEQVDFEKAQLTIPRHEMKVKDSNLPDFTLPLSTQAIEVLKEAHILTGWGQWVFHGLKNIHGPINKESGNKALRLMGFTDEASGRKQTLHSFRGTFRSLAETRHEDHGASFVTMERVLDHHEKSGVVRSYSHKADYVKPMRKLLQWWADYLDGLKNATMDKDRR